jgi:sec-independent protein translocase protein TatA
MGATSIWHWLVVIALVLLLFGGRGKLSGLMKDFAEGIKGFRKGLSEEDKAQQASGAQIPADGKTIDVTATQKDKADA